VGGQATLSVMGALTHDGKSSLVIEPATSRGEVREEIAGLGDAAAYWENGDTLYRGIAANWKSYVVDVSTTGVDPGAPKAAFIPLVRKTLGQLR
jgi:hypothetical protein